MPILSDLQKASGVARTTFYRAFDNISDILYWKCDTCFYEVLGKYHPEPPFSEVDLARHYFRYWVNRSDILELLIQINRQDIIYACHMKNAEILQERFGQIPGLPIKYGNYFIAIRTGFTISVLTTWLKGEKKESDAASSTVSREINRNKKADGTYSANHAEKLYRKQRKKCGKKPILKEGGAREYVPAFCFYCSISLFENLLITSCAQIPVNAPARQPETIKNGR